jgi:formylmethanofuran dehydrogenase subunit E
MDTVDQVVRFHGHLCPGLALGIRAAQVALREIGPHAEDEEVVAIVETDMCAVDAIQYLVGCTFGKGNLVHKDYGKNAFTFVRRSDGKAIRVMTRSRAWDIADRAARAQAILDAPEGEILIVRETAVRVPAEARVHPSLRCEECAEDVMETRIRRIKGRQLCIPCFERYERRW